MQIRTDYTAAIVNLKVIERMTACYAAKDYQGVVDCLPRVEDLEEP